MRNKRAKALLKSLKRLKDFRTKKGQIKYDLGTILFLTFLAKLCGKRFQIEIIHFMEDNKDNQKIKDILQIDEILVPKLSNYNKMISNSDTTGLEKVFRKFFNNKCPA